MQLFYDPGASLGEFRLDETESRHAVRVLRLTAGDGIHVTDGRGNLFSGVIRVADPKSSVAELTEVIRQWEKRPYGLTIAVAPPKNPERMEWFLEKATEVGVDTVVPLLCSHSERRQLKTEREKKVIVAAAKQSLKAYFPHIEELTPFAEVVRRPFDGVKLIAHCEEGFVPRRTFGRCVSAGDNMLVLIGPEGDFSKEEITFALENGFCGITLGTARLRTETAALAVVMQAAFINQ